CTLMLLGGVVSTYAYVYVNGSSYQTVNYVDIPGGGYHKFNTYYGSKKMNSTTLGTFYKTWGQAALGNYGGFITSSETSVSELVGLPTNKHNWASEHGASKGGVYFTAVTSHNFEPSNTCDLTLKFSADTLDLPN
ncbi:MAG: hypothetical protein RR518_11075, partial [Coprobacillus sp.]